MKTMKIASADEVFNEYDLELLRGLCVNRRELTRTSPSSISQRERQSIAKCIRLLGVTLDKLKEKKP
jgi:hypothetical protein